MTTIVERATADDATRDGEPAPRRRRAPSVLHEIAAHRRADLASELAGHDRRAAARAADAAPRPRDVAGTLARPGLHLIAEIKRRSPSAGAIAGGDLDVAARARAYQSGGAAVISVLVENRYFGGSIDDLRAARAATTVPVLAKEFVVDARQLPLLRAAGADAVLLLAALHPARRLARLVRAGPRPRARAARRGARRARAGRRARDRCTAHRHQQPRPADARDRPRARRPAARAHPRRPDRGRRVRRARRGDPAALAGARLSTRRSSARS